MKRIILASASPRRRELLAALVPEFEVVPSDIPEDVDGAPESEATRLAAEKAAAVAAANPGALVLGSDTIVHDGVRAYGKPTDAAEAEEMLRVLRGREHRVITGVALANDGTSEAACSAATVRLSALTDAAIREYVASGRPLDKAGAYAIQDLDVPTVAYLVGCYCAVVGLPLWRTKAMLEAAGVECSSPEDTFFRCAGCPEKPRDARLPAL